MKGRQSDSQDPMAKKTARDCVEISLLLVPIHDQLKASLKRKSRQRKIRFPFETGIQTEKGKSFGKEDHRRKIQAPPPQLPTNATAHTHRDIVSKFHSNTRIKSSETTKRELQLLCNVSRCVFLSLSLVVLPFSRRKGISEALSQVTCERSPYTDTRMQKANGAGDSKTPINSGILRSLDRQDRLASCHCCCCCCCSGLQPRDMRRLMQREDRISKSLCSHSRTDAHTSHHTREVKGDHRQA